MDSDTTMCARGVLRKKVSTTLLHGINRREWLPALRQAHDDVATWRTWIKPFFGTALNLEFEKIALQVALAAPVLPSDHAAVTLAYLRAAVDGSGYNADPRSDLGLSLRELAGSPSLMPAWTDEMTGEQALQMLFRSVRALAALLHPADLHRDHVGNPCRDLEHRFMLASQVTSYGFLSRMEDVIPPPDTDPPVADFAFALAEEVPSVRLHDVQRADDAIVHSSRAGRTQAAENFANELGRSRLEHCNLSVPGLKLELCLTVPQSFVFRDGIMRNAAKWTAQNRPYQLLLLAVMLDRGVDSRSPLLAIHLPLDPDLCYAIRGMLHDVSDEYVDWYHGRAPTLKPDEWFAWHVYSP